MINIDTREKYISGEPNAYYEGFVENKDFYKGYMFALQNLEEVLDAMQDDLFGEIEIPIVKTILNQIAEKCSDYVNETMEYNKDEMIVWLIDKMPASEWIQKRAKLFDADLEGYEVLDTCPDGTGVSFGVAEAKKKEEEFNK